MDAASDFLSSKRELSARKYLEVKTLWELICLPWTSLGYILKARGESWRDVLALSLRGFLHCKLSVQVLWSRWAGKIVSRLPPTSLPGVLPLRLHPAYLHHLMSGTCWSSLQPDRKLDMAINHKEITFSVIYREDLSLISSWVLCVFKVFFSTTLLSLNLDHTVSEAIEDSVMSQQMYTKKPSNLAVTVLVKDTLTMQTGNQTSNFPVTGRLALPPGLQWFVCQSFSLSITLPSILVHKVTRSNQWPLRNKLASMLTQQWWLLQRLAYMLL